MAVHPRDHTAPHGMFIWLGVYDGYGYGYGVKL